jgi:6-phosphogluconate dehydrogenase (decarboxylating)
MQLGMIGLRRIGVNMVRRLMRGGYSCVVHHAAAAPMGVRPAPHQQTVLPLDVRPRVHAADRG